MARSNINFEQLACNYACKYGIVDYKVVGSKMIYVVSYPAYLNNPRYSVKHTVDLISGSVQSEKLKRYSRKGAYNR